MDKTKIQWTDATWNPARGCSRVSPGCDNCYAMREAHRHDYPAIEELGPDGLALPGRPLERPAGAYEGLTRIGKRGIDWAGFARLVPSVLDQPLRWKRPRRIFVNSMSDLFHESLTNEEIAAIFGVMAAAPAHAFQVLTKRPKRALEWFAWAAGKHGHDEAGALHVALCDAMQGVGDWDPDDRHCEELLSNAAEWPLRNVWLGVSTENQQTADERIPMLLELPAAVRFISAEPLLESVSVWAFLKGETRDACLDTLGGSSSMPGLDWIIVGGESGNGARPFDLEWARDIVKQCAAGGVPCFIKQMGADPIDGLAGCSVPFASKKGDDMTEWPTELRVREFPAVRP